MFRRSLSVLLILVIAAAGYQPALGMTGANAPAMEMAADCPEMQKDDCCNQTEKGKRLCAWNDACAARCHVNVGIEAAPYAPTMCGGAVAAPASRAWQAVKSARAGPLFRPPIV
jgi:hypothetical protein